MPPEPMPTNHNSLSAVSRPICVGRLLERQFRVSISDVSVVSKPNVLGIWPVRELEERSSERTAPLDEQDTLGVSHRSMLGFVPPIDS